MPLPLILIPPLLRVLFRSLLVAPRLKVARFMLVKTLLARPTLLAMTPRLTSELALALRVGLLLGIKIRRAQLP